MSLDETGIRRVLEAGEQELAQHATPDGHVTFVTPAHIAPAHR